MSEDYIETIPGYYLPRTDVGCEKYPFCFNCTLDVKECNPDRDTETERRKQQKKEAAKRYRQRHKDREKERHKAWKEKQRLAKLLDQKRAEAETEANTT